MTYPVPGITVNQGAPQPQPGGAPLGRTITALFNAPQGPDTAVKIDASQIVNVYGDPSSPKSAGYTGPMILKLLTGQQAAPRAQSLQIIGLRVGVTRAQATITDNVSGHPFVLQGIGAYAGSKGNSLQVAINAPQVWVSELQKGNGIQPEIEQIVFYGLGGTPTGGVTLGFNGTNASAPITAATITGAGAAAALATYLTGITSVGANNVTVLALASPLAGAFAFQVTFAGTLATGPQPLFSVGASTLAAGTGAIPVLSVAINDISTGTPITKLQLTQGQYDLSSNAKIFNAINAANPTTSPASVVQAATLSGTAGLPITQTLTLAGGADGLGALPTDATIAPLLAASLALGNTDFVVAGFDAAAIVGAIETYLASALATNIYPKAILGPAQGTTYASLSTTYQAANSDRIVYVGHDNLVGTNPTNGVLNWAFDGFYAAAAIAGIKAASGPEQNLYGASLSGFTSQPPIAPDLGAPLTLTQLNTLASAGFTVLVPAPATGRLAIRDLISTAPSSDQYGQLNRFIYLSERDAFDTIAIQLISGLSPLIGSPASTPAQVLSMFNDWASQIMTASLGRLHNGATATASYDVVRNVVTINVGYGDRPPLNQIIINLAPIAGYNPAAGQ